MRPIPFSSRLLPALFLLTAGTLRAAETEPVLELPKLIAKDGGGTKWKNLNELEQFAARGDPQACFELGDRLMAGEGFKPDLPRARALFEQAAQGGVVDAWFRLGKIHHDGLGVTPDYGRALDYFTLAARAGVPEAQHNIGAMLVSARGVQRDYVEGLAWLIVATKSGAASEDEANVRLRLAQRPADVEAAEARAAELMKDLPNATVNAMRKGTDATAQVVVLPKVKAAAPAAVAPEKPVIVPPRIEVPAPSNPTLPAPPAPAATPQKKH